MNLGGPTLIQINISLLAPRYINHLFARTKPTMTERQQTHRGLPDYERKIALLQQPDIYPEQPARIEVIEYIDRYVLVWCFKSGDLNVWK